jgi:hypothetical protein
VPSAVSPSAHEAIPANKQRKTATKHWSPRILSV